MDSTKESLFPIIRHSSHERFRKEIGEPVDNLDVVELQLEAMAEAKSEVVEPSMRFFA